MREEVRYNRLWYRRFRRVALPVLATRFGAP